MKGYTDFAERLRRIILPDVPMTSEAEWELHRVFVDRLHLFILIPLKARMLSVTSGMSDEEVNNLYEDILLFFKERYAEDGSLRAPSKVDGPKDISMHWAHEDQMYVNVHSLFFSHHLIRLMNGASVNLVVVPPKEGNPKNASELKGRRYVLFDSFFAPKETEANFFEVPCSPVESVDDDLFVYFHFRTDELKRAQGKLNDLTEKYVRDFVTTRQEKKFASLMGKEANGKTLFRNELNKFTRKVAGGTGDKFIHKDLESHLNAELSEFIKARLLNLDAILGRKF